MSDDAVPQHRGGECVKPARVGVASISTSTSDPNLYIAMKQSAGHVPCAVASVMDWCIARHGGMMYSTVEGVLLANVDGS